MSVHIQSRIWQMEFGDPSAKLVAVAIADMANDDGFCWPSLPKLAKRCGLSEDSVRRHIRKMEIAGILTHSSRFVDGRQSSNSYQFAEVLPVEGVHARIPMVCVDATPPLHGRQGDPGTGARGEGGTGARENHKKESPSEPSNESLPPTPKNGNAPPLPAKAVQESNGKEYPEEFLEFWKIYPRREAKGDALKAWQKLRPPLEKVKATVAWQRNSTSWTKDGGQFIPLPASWLNSRRWEDEPADQSSRTPGLFKF